MTNLHTNGILIENGNLVSNINEKELPEYLFLNENDPNDLVFNCSTPDKNKSDNEVNLMEFVSGDNFNLSTDSLKLFEYENETKKDLITNSLIEFEETEKLVANQSIVSTNSALKAPITQMESMLKNLRSNYNYKESDILNPIRVLEETPKCVDQSLNNIEALMKDIMPLNAKYQPPEQQKTFNSYTRKNDHISALENRLENEIVRRQHCEKQIHELNEHMLELEQQLAVAEGLDKKRETFAKNMDLSLQKILENWKLKEKEVEANLSKLKFEKQNSLTIQTKMGMKNQLMEQEIEKLGNDLVNEKVKSQEYANQITNLKNQLNEFENASVEKSKKLEISEASLIEISKERDAFREDLNQCRTRIEKLQEENKTKELCLTTEIEKLKSNNQSLSKQNNNLQLEYENLINEAKLVVEESEKQYDHLKKCVDNEKLAKDALQAEINMLVEKYETKVKSLSSEYDTKVKILKNQSLEKEKIISDSHRSDIEKLETKSRYDIDKLKSKYYDDLQSKTSDYELKLTDLKLKIDSLQSEIERLNRANKDLETERNTIRQNLKHMLELQMKETMQLLGIQNSENKHKPSTSLTSFSASDLNTFTKPKHTDILLNKYTNNKINHSQEENRQTSLDNFLENLKADIKTFNTDLKTTSSPKQQSQLDSSNTISTSTLLNEDKGKDKQEKVEIKDAFILNQIDLINKYYQIDNNTLAAAAAVSNVQTNSSLSSNTSQTSNSKLEQKSVSNLSSNLHEDRSLSISNNNESKSNTSRAHELRHYIELLLNKSPSGQETQKETFTLNESKRGEKQVEEEDSDSTSLSETYDDFESDDKRGYHDISDIDLGYTKRQSSEYYDDVKRNLNFDFDDSEDDQDQSLTDKPVESVKQVKLADKSKLNCSIGSSKFGSNLNLKQAPKSALQITRNNLSKNSLTSNSSSHLSSISQVKANQKETKQNLNQSINQTNKAMKTSISTLNLASNVGSNKKVWK